MNRTKTAGLLAAALSTLGGAAAASAYATSFPSTTGCHLTAGTPATANYSVGAWTGRYGCQNTATMSGQLKRDVSFSPDPIDVAGTKSGVRIDIRVEETCSTHGRATYYTHVESNGGTSGDGTHVTKC